ncbi:putative carboxylic ester hydrolase [Rosa chinensis]|uniref:Phospholipase A1 n=1 Tax=Rosa chinensis TaxID=74649 RepID=A0A2P6P8J3_ROSCH|nr:phospholipase A1-IIgamma [Rosa chinensis]PRQ18232.1 putative carboxylic ester hydrolase [Rosa chinensis]
MAGGIATKWKVLSGEDDWKDLLDPPHIDLRHYIIHCGERAGAVAVVHEPKSKNYRLPRYLKEHLFSKMGLQSGNPYKYVVKEYLYATIPLLSIGKSNFLGFVAVTTDEGAKVLGRRDVLISWRGTQLEHEYLVDADTALVSASDILGSNNGLDPLVHQGWLSYYTHKDILSPHNKLHSCRDQVLAALKSVIEEYKDEKISITVTGHSMGAAIATLNATDIVCNGHNKPTDQSDKLIPVTAIVFASPRLGDEGFEKVFSGLENLHVLRVTNDQDIVPKLPLDSKYVHVGKALIIDSLKSTYLKVIPESDKVRRLSSLHDLEVYLHGVAGTQGTESNDFKLEVNRDLALVNKYIDLLKDEHKVVGSWWTEKNKSMSQMDDGSWVLDDGES